MNVTARSGSRWDKCPRLWHLRDLNCSVHCSSQHLFIAVAPGAGGPRDSRAACVLSKGLRPKPTCFAQRLANSPPRVAPTVFRSHSATSFLDSRRRRPLAFMPSDGQAHAQSDVWLVPDHARLVEEPATSSWRSSVDRLTALPTHRVRCHSNPAGSPPFECSTPFNEARDIGKRGPARDAGRNHRGRTPR